MRARWSRELRHRHPRPGRVGVREGRGRRATDAGFAVVIAPLMHGAAQWGTLNGLINGRTTVLTPKFDAHEVWRAVEKYKIPTLSITGDAMGRPLIEALEEGGYDASSLVAVASTAAVFSATVKARSSSASRTSSSPTPSGSTETGYNGVRVIMKGGEERPGLPDRAHGSRHRRARRRHEHRAARLGRRRPHGPRRQRAVAVPQGSGEVGRDLRDGERPALLGLRRLRGRRGRRHDDAARARLGVHQLRRREDLSRRGRGRVEGASRSVRRRRRRRARRAMGRARRGGHRDAARQAVTLEELDAHTRLHVAGYKVPRELHVVDKIERSPSGKPDYPWAKRIATATAS